MTDELSSSTVEKLNIYMKNLLLEYTRNRSKRIELELEAEFVKKNYYDLQMTSIKQQLNKMQKYTKDMDTYSPKEMAGALKQLDFARLAVENKIHKIYVKGLYHLVSHDDIDLIEQGFTPHIAVTLDEVEAYGVRFE